MINIKSYYQMVEQMRPASASQVQPEPHKLAGPSLAIRNLRSKFEAESIYEKGRVCKITWGNESDMTFNLAGREGRKEAEKILKRIDKGDRTLFARIQSVSVEERPLSQIKQTFDGMIGGVYGGGIAQIKVVGITKIWSSCGEISLGVNAELDNIHQLFNLLANARGAVFHFHDGIAVQKWKVIPASFSSAKTAQQNNMETYDIGFIGASFNQNFKHIEEAGAYLDRFSGPTARYQIRKIR